MDFSEGGRELCTLHRIWGVLAGEERGLNKDSFRRVWSKNGCCVSMMHILVSFTIIGLCLESKCLCAMAMQLIGRMELWKEEGQKEEVRRLKLGRCR